MILHADSLIGQARHKGAVCGLIGEKMHEISCGVCAKVSGIRFHPSHSPTGPVLSLRNVPGLFSARLQLRADAPF